MIIDDQYYREYCGPVSRLEKLLLTESGIEMLISLSPLTVKKLKNNIKIS